MTDVEFFELVKKKVRDYANDHLDKSDNVQITEDNVYIVWYCKTLQNWKALASTTLLDGMYYELTLNGDKYELYLDAYKKFENKCFYLDKFNTKKIAHDISDDFDISLRRLIEEQRKNPNPNLKITYVNDSKGFYKNIEEIKETMNTDKIN